MNQTLVSTKYQVVIPKEVRKKIKLAPGQKMNVNLVGDQIILSPAKTETKLNWPEDHLKKLKGLWKSSSDIEKYLEEEDKSWE